MIKITDPIKKKFSSLLGVLVFLGFIGCLCIGTLIFAFRLYNRNRGSSYLKNRSAISSNWGSSLEQNAPALKNYYDSEELSMIKEGLLDKDSVESNVKILRSKINTNLKMDYRRKGLTYFPTFITQFEAVYTIKNSNDRKINANFNFPLSSGNNLVWDVVMTVGGAETNVEMTDKGLFWKGRLEAMEEKEVVVKYMARGMENFSYSLSSTKGLQDFELDMLIDGAESIDIPSSSLSPSLISEDNEKKVKKLSWKFEKVLTSPTIEVLMYSKKNLYEQVGRLIIGAAVMIPAYLGLLFVFSKFIKKEIKLFDYGLLAAIFTSFYPLFSYMTSIVDKFDIYTNLVISSLAISVIILVHLWQVLDSVGLLFGVASQFLFFAFFPYAILNPAYTGLMITIGIVMLLAVVVVMRGKMLKNK